MKIIFTFIFIGFTLSYCFGQTQLEMNETAHKQFENADKELNTTYQKILEEYKADSNFVKNLKIAQRLWIQFRDAEMKVKYPEEQYGYYGSIFPMCWSMYLTDLTQARIKDLKIWLAGTEEGDVCSGSVKIKE